MRRYRDSRRIVEAGANRGRLRAEASCPPAPAFALRASAGTHGRRTLGSVCGALVLALAGGVWAQGVFEDLRMPLEHYPDGQRRSEFRARAATVRPDGQIEATGVVIRFFHPDGQIESVVEANACVANRATRTAESDAPVRLTRPGLLLTGVGFRWDADAEQLHIRSAARLELNRAALEAERVRRQADEASGGDE